MRRTGRVNRGIMRFSRRRIIRRIVRISALELVIINKQSCYKGNPIFLYDGKYVYEDPEDESSYIEVNIVN